MKISTVIKVAPNARVFLVEDSAERVAWFKKKLGERLVGIHANPELAVQALYHLDPFSLSAVFLDHDLGYERHCLTSLRVAMWLAKHTMIDPTWSRRVVIHSYNENGARNIRSILGGGTILPFGSFDIEVESE